MKTNNKGFTLVEVIVVLTIIALLSAVTIPSFTGWVDKAEERVCFSNMAFVKRSYMSLAAFEEYSVSSPKDLLQECVSEIGGSDVSDNAKTYKSPCGGTCTVVYTPSNSEIKSITCSIHGSLGDDVVGLLKGSNPLGTFEDALANATTANGKSVGSQFHSAIDSSAPDGAEFTTAILDYFANKTPPIDLSGSGIESWSLQRTEGALVMWWTDQDVSQVAVGESVRVIRYNTNSQTYTAGYMKVTATTDANTGTTYNILSRPGQGVSLASVFSEYKKGESDGQTTATKASYDDTLDFFNAMDETKS